MKKLFILGCAALALVATSCNNESETTLNPEGNYGFINLNLGADELLNTRATVSGDDLNNWMVEVNSDAAISASAIASKAYAASNTNTLSVYNYANMDAALAANAGRGAGYWTGTSDNFVIEAGKSTSVNVDCGAPQNAAFKVVFNETFTSIADEDYKVVATSGERNIPYDASHLTDGFFAPTTTMSYTLTGTIGEKAVNITKSDITLTAGKRTILTVNANTNGTITLEINYDDFTNENSSITVDALTGGEAAQS